LLIGTFWRVEATIVLLALFRGAASRKARKKPGYSGLIRMLAVLRVGWLGAWCARRKVYPWVHINSWSSDKKPRYWWRQSCGRRGYTQSSRNNSSLTRVEPDTTTTIRCCMWQRYGTAVVRCTIAMLKDWKPANGGSFHAK
jgi:hypothetical protein